MQNPSLCKRRVQMHFLKNTNHFCKFLFFLLVGLAPLILALKIKNKNFYYHGSTVDQINVIINFLVTKKSFHVCFLGFALSVVFLDF